MTNKDKFLRDGVSTREFLNEIDKLFSKSELKYVDETINDWLYEPIQPTLTEDERVILRNMNKKYKTIGRDKTDKGLYIALEDDRKNFMFDCIFPDLFQFIKERRRIRDKGVVRR